MEVVSIVQVSGDAFFSVCKLLKKGALLEAESSPFICSFFRSLSFEQR